MKMLTIGGILAAITIAASFACWAAAPPGTVVCWGNNNYGQVTPPVSISDAIAVAAGDDHSLAVERSRFAAEKTELGTAARAGRRLEIFFGAHRVEAG